MVPSSSEWENARLRAAVIGKMYRDSLRARSSPYYRSGWASRAAASRCRALTNASGEVTPQLVFFDIPLLGVDLRRPGALTKALEPAGRLEVLSLLVEG